MKKAFYSRYLLPDWKSPLIEDAALLVENGKVRYVGKRDQVKKLGGFEEETDFGISLVMPSFVNAHTHVAMIVLRGLGEGLKLEDWLRKIWKAEEKMDEDVLEIASLYGLSEMVSSGITTFIDFYNVPPMVKALKKIKARAMLTLAFMDKVKYMEEESWKRLKRIDYYLSLTKSVCSKLALGPHSLYTCSSEILKEIKEISDKFNLSIHIHLAETRDEIKNVLRDKGKRPLGVLKELGLLNDRLIAAHGVHLGEDEIIELSRSKATIVHCPRSNSRLGSGIAKVAEMLKREVNVALGTDGPASSENFDIFEEMRTCIYIQRALLESSSAISIRDCIKMATENGGKAVRMNVGSLKPGREADFIVIDLKGLEVTWDILTSVFYLTNKDRIRYVYIGGEKIFENGEILSIDINEVKLKAFEALSSLL